MSRDPDDPAARARRLAAKSLAGGDATGWFDRLYIDAEHGRTDVPWDRGEANPILAGWFAADGRRGDGATAIVIGSGLGDDAELVASRGFRTRAFDISPTAVRAAEARHPGSPVHYHVANLLTPPPVSTDSSCDRRSNVKHQDLQDFTPTVPYSTDGWPDQREHPP